MKKIVFLFGLMACIGFCTAQTADTVYKTLNKQAKEMGQFLISKNFKEFVKYTHPKVVEMMGGDQEMATILENGFKDWDRQGVKLLSVIIGETPEIVEQKEELQAIVPQTLEIQMNDKVVIAESSLIAFSFNSGNDWKFVDANGKTINEMKSLFPNLSDRLVIPEKKPLKTR